MQAQLQQFRHQHPFDLIDPPTFGTGLTDRLGREVKKALGWSSRQGERFLGEITRQVAGILAASGTQLPDAEAVAQGLVRADRPHHWIDEVVQREINPGRYNLCEFRSNVIHEVARQQFTRDKNEITAVDAAVKQVLAAWIRTGRLVPPHDPQRLGQDDLTFPERRDALRMAFGLLHPVGPTAASSEERSVYGLALTQLVHFEANAWKWGEPVVWDRAEEAAIAFAVAFPNGCPLATVKFTWQLVVIDTLQQELDLLNESLMNWETMRNRFGETPEVLEGHCFPLARLASTMMDVGQHETARQFLRMARRKNIQNCKRR